MSCEHVHREMMAEKYVAGRLSEDARDEFEGHFFECESCFREVEALRAVKSALPLARPKSNSVNWMLAFPVAAALFLAVVLWHRPAPPQQAKKVTASARQRAPDYVALAQFEPPPWNPVLLRGNETAGHAEFVKAMTLYTAHNYPGCGEALSVIESAEARYYGGICFLLAGQAEAGASALAQAIAKGDTPYLEEARFYLAKAMLARKDAAGARDELRRVVAMHGDLERQANDLLGLIH